MPYVGPRADRRGGARPGDREDAASPFHRSLPLEPASNEKLTVTFAALEELGPQFVIDTDVLGTGSKRRHDLGRAISYLQGHGDPTLSSAGLRQLARDVARRGIRRVTGGIVADESFFDARRTGPGWKPSFYIDESPPLSALAVDRGWTGTHTSHDPALTAAVVFRKPRCGRRT